MMYEEFATIYDILMDEVPYDEWAKYIVEVLKKYNINDGIIADLGCGTGVMTRKLHKAGFDMIGIDSSDQMLGIARQYEDSNILYLLQDITEFELYGTVRACISTCDTMNYICEFEELVKVFELVANYLDNDGIFIFDIKTVFTYNNILGKNTFAWNLDNGSVIWDNFYDEESKINQYELTMYLKDDLLSTIGNDNCMNQNEQNIESIEFDSINKNVDSLNALNKKESYSRYEEVHFQRAYSIEEIEKASKLAKLKILEITDAYSNKELSIDSERALVVLKRENNH